MNTIPCFDGILYLINILILHPHIFVNMSVSGCELCCFSHIYPFNPSCVNIRDFPPVNTVVTPLVTSMFPKIFRTLSEYIRWKVVVCVSRQKNNLKTTKKTIWLILENRHAIITVKIKNWVEKECEIKFLSHWIIY